MIGYRWYESVGVAARYPFGHGLSYTTFALTDLSVDVTGDDRASASLTVTNTGPVAGEHVVQIYIGNDDSPVRRPLRELRAFTKVNLQPGEARTVHFDLGRRAFAYWDTEFDTWIVTPGEYTVQACQDAATVLLQQPIQLTGDLIIRELTLDSTIDQWFTHPISSEALQGFLANNSSDDTKPGITKELLRMVSSMPMRKFVNMMGDAVPAGVFTSFMEQSWAAAHALRSKDRAS